MKDDNEIAPTEVASRIKNTLDYPSESYAKWEMTRVIFFAAYHKELNALYRIDPHLSVDTSSYEINLFCKSRESTLAVMAIFAVPNMKWNRDSTSDGRIKYTKTFDMSHIGLRADMTINVSGTPPASCKIVEEELEVPACKRKVKRIVCKEGDDVPTLQDPEPTATVEPGVNGTPGVNGEPTEAVNGEPTVEAEPAQPTLGEATNG